MPSNPFSTRFIQPGSIAYHRLDGGSVADLANRFLQLPKKRGSIIGPHGSGKSTFVASLIEELKRSRPDHEIYPLRFSSSHSAAASLNTSIGQWGHSSIAILDGYEQLTIWSRFKVAWIASKRSIRILATAHQTISGFETLWCTSVSDASSRWVIEQLLQNSSLPNADSQRLVIQLMETEDWKRSRDKHGQNLRETLFDMYDWWQERHK